MDTTRYIITFASAYGACDYGNSTFQNGQTCSTASTGGNSGTDTSGGGTLTNTGIAVAAVVTLAALILLAALVVRIWKRPSKKPSTLTDK